MAIQSPPKNPTLAAVLSCLFNGLGQIYNGEITKGVIIFVVQIVNALLMTIVIGFVTLPIVWVWSIYDAYKVAKRINEEAAQQVVATTKVCPRCAERVNSGARVCHFCNYQFMSDGASPAAQPMAPFVPAASWPASSVSSPSPLPIAAPPPPMAAPAAYSQPPMAAPAAYSPPAVPLSAARFCPKCGQQVAPTSRFCFTCGSPLGQPAV